MVNVRFKGPLKRSIGFEEVKVNGGNLEDILREISEILGIEIFLEGEKAFIRANVDGTKVKFAVSLFHNGKNVVLDNVKEILSGDIDVITPIGGG